jgi:hypothetical protein
MAVGAGVVAAVAVGHVTAHASSPPQTSGPFLSSSHHAFDTQNGVKSQGNNVVFNGPNGQSYYHGSSFNTVTLGTLGGTGGVFDAGNFHDFENGSNNNTLFEGGNGSGTGNRSHLYGATFENISLTGVGNNLVDGDKPSGVGGFNNSLTLTGSLNTINILAGASNNKVTFTNTGGSLGDTLTIQGTQPTSINSVTINSSVSGANITDNVGVVTSTNASVTQTGTVSDPVFTVHM